MANGMNQEGDGWTLATLHAHLLTILDERDKRYGQRFTDLETALRAALAASEKAINKAEVATERRFESVNEFRTTLSDQAANFITRSEAEAATARNSERIQELMDRINRSEGRGAGLGTGWMYLVGAVGVIATVITIALALGR
jgi:hypothetical protein